MKRQYNKCWLLINYVLFLVLFQVYVECAETEKPQLPTISFLEERMSSISNFGRQFNDGGSGEYTCDGPTRTTWQGKKVCKRFCGMDSDDTCHFVDYAQSISKVAAAGIVLFVLSLISLPIFCCGRFVCNCFGGRNRSKGVCCGKQSDFEGYSRSEVWIVKIALFLCMVAIGVCCIVGYTGNSNTSKGLNKFTGTIIDTSENIIDRVQIIGQKLEALPYTVDIGQTIQDASDQGQDVIDQVKDIKVQVDGYNSYRSAALITSFALPLGLLVVGLLGAILNFRMLALFAAIFCFLCSMVIWLSFGVHSVVNTVMVDLCKEIDIYLEDNANTPANITSGANEAIQSIIKCTQGGSFSDIENLATDAIDQAYGYACEGLQNICGNPQASCPSNYVGSNCTRNTITLFLNDTITDFLIGCNQPGYNCPDNSGTCPSGDEILCYNASITVRDCKDNCVNPDLKDLANQTVVNMDLLFLYEDIYNNDIFPLLNCSLVKEAYDTVYDSLCDTMAGAIGKIAVASAVLGAFLIPGTILLILGFKRFRSNRGPSDGKDANIAMTEVDKSEHHNYHDDVHYEEKHASQPIQAFHEPNAPPSHTSFDPSKHMSISPPGYTEAHHIVPVMSPQYADDSQYANLNFVNGAIVDSHHQQVPPPYDPQNFQ